MARPAAESVGLFYPTPEVVTERLTRWLAPAPGPGVVRLLDPCAGTGEPAARLAGALRAESYGIELHADRGAACAAVLDHVLVGSLFEAQVASHGFSVSFENPPYTASGDADRRLEQSFLAATTRLLAPTGVLVFIIRQRWLGVSARYLASHYTTLRVYRFPDPAFAAFGQIVVLAKRKPRPARDEATAAWLSSLVTADLPPLPDGPPEGVAAYQAPRLPAGSLRFCSAQPSAAQVLADLDEHGGAWARPLLRAQLWPVQAVPAVRPLLPLRTGHVAMLMAAGLLDNLVLTHADERLLLKGRIVKEYVEVERDDAAGEVRERERIRTEITTLDLTSGQLAQIQTGGHATGGTTLAAFMERYREPLAALVRAAYPPLYSAEQRHLYADLLAELRRRPLGAQADVIRATTLHLLRAGHADLVGEMGVGKTLMAIACAHLLAQLVARSRINSGTPPRQLRPFRVVVLAPPHLVGKWHREVLATAPNAEAIIIDTLGGVDWALRHANAHLQVLILSRERAKLGTARRAGVWWRRLPAAGGERQPCCPQCGALVPSGRDSLLLTDEAIVRTRARCAECRTPLWQAQAAPLATGRRGRFRWGDRPGAPLAGATGAGPRRFPLADYLRRRARGRLDLAIIDEVQEFKSKESAQGMAAAALAEAARRVLDLTGTLFGGKASSLFYLLYRFHPTFRQEFGYRDLTRWIDLYGVWERVTKLEEAPPGGYGTHTRRQLLVTAPQEKPGVAPSIIRHVLGHTSFVRLANVVADLPPYREFIHRIELERRAEPGLIDQATAYQTLEGELLAAVRAALAAGSKHLLGAYVQALLAYPDACTKGEVVVDRLTGEVLAQAPALPADHLYPKERALLDLARREQARGRRVLVYCTHTGTRDITDRLARLLADGGLRVAVLKQSSAEPRAREAWLAARVQAGLDVLVTNPRLVALGLDLVDFPSIHWHEIDYSLYVLRQASRRSWRLGQRQPVEVHYSVYASTLQARALALVASKLRAALQVEGDITDDGLAGADGVEQDLVTELARSLAREASAEPPLESLFASLHTLEQRQDVALVDGAGDDGGRSESWDAERLGSSDAREPCRLPTSEPAIAAVGETTGLAGWRPSALVPSTAGGLTGRLPSGRRRPSQPRSRPAGPAVTQLDLFTTALPAPPDPRSASAAEDEAAGAQLTLW